MWYEIKGSEVSQQANAVLAYLKGEWSIEGVEDRDLRCHTAAWYNGRERGYSVTVTDLTGKMRKNLVVTFAEHRNSDSIFCAVSCNCNCYDRIGRISSITLDEIASSNVSISFHFEDSTSINC